MNCAGLFMVPSLDGSSNASPKLRSRLLSPRRSRSVENCSLPLKKRRFLHMSLSLQDEPANDDDDEEEDKGSDPTSTMVVLSEEEEVPSLLPSDPSFHNTEDERLAALALISASSVVHVSSPPPDSPIPVGTHRHVTTSPQDDPLSAAAIAMTHLATPRSAVHQVISSTTIHTTLERFVSQGPVLNFVSPLPVKPVPLQCHPADDSATSSLSVSSSSEDDENEEDQHPTVNHGSAVQERGDDDESTTSPSTRIKPYYDPSFNQASHNSNARLTRPLPNGCHGKTSRYNSYCRRQPCFQGSNYCKLHYSLNNKNDENNLSSSSCEESIKAIVVPAGPSSNDNHKGNLAPPPPPSTNTMPFFHLVTNAIQSNAPQQQQQDKRFTGSPGETRCQATTTRGRACAYVAVGDPNKYCHLHADYERNPPARRNKAVLIASTTSLMQRGSKVFVVGNNNKTTKTKNNKGPPHGDSEHKGKPDGGSTNSFPLLSMLSTDVWFNKRVIISTGPFLNRTGHVLRWGNGWVTVKLDVDADIPGTEKEMLHNRRSFELFLHPDQKTGL
ncbi:hypothetical protein IV203_030310 [Nitzschia inconspicua]|uniref:Uncharacterized protein n=1 Tax=Nitzschia inconspicua TaxID=303405 RepID=A0A9K3LSC1_9STRA|nr:hypothetical protein IV203_030310 [Nitzschia inconspicua]